MFQRLLLGSCLTLAYITLALPMQPALAQSGAAAPAVVTPSVPQPVTPLPANAPLPLCEALKDPTLYNAKENEESAFLTAGKDNWVYASRDTLKTRFRINDITKDSYRRLDQALKYYGAELVVTILPTRGLIINDQLLAPDSTNFKFAAARTNYLRMLDEFRHTGITVTDMSGVDTVKDFYRKGSTDWTPAGAAFTAQRTADAIKSLGVYKDLAKNTFLTGVAHNAVDTADDLYGFVNKICGTNYAVTHFDAYPLTLPEHEGVTQDDLFAETPKPAIVLWGTENSTAPGPTYANFDGYLKQSLQTDVDNDAVAEGNMEGAAMRYLISNKLKTDKPKIIVWEMNALYGFNNQDFLRELIPSVHGECSDSDALETSRGDISGFQTALFTDLAGKGYNSHNYYVAFNLDGNDERGVVLNLTYADGKKDSFKLNRSDRAFPKNPPRYFFELADHADAPLDTAEVEVKNAVGKFRAKICKVPGKLVTNSISLTRTRSEPIKSGLAGKLASVFDKKVEQLNPAKKYVLASAENAAPAAAPPQLPDLSGYTKQAIIDKMPAVQPGKIVIDKMKGSPPLRLFVFGKRLTEAQHIQDIVEPEAVHVYNGVYDLPALVKAINDPSVLAETDSAYILRLPVAVYPEATLILDNLKKPLLMSQDKGAFIVAAGKLFILDTTVTGWNEKNKQPAVLNKTLDSFRPFITTWDGSQLYIANSTFHNLGYAWSKSYGLSVSTNIIVQEEFEFKYGDLVPPTGWIIDSSFDNMYFGFYSYEAANVAVLRNTYKDNIIYGIDPHDRSDHLIIAYNKVSGSHKKHGIIMSRDVNNSFIFNNVSTNNKGSGIMLDRNCVNTVVANNTVAQNHGDGITVYESPNNLFYNNTIYRNDTGGLRVRNSTNIRVSGGENRLNKDFALIVYEDPLTTTNRNFKMDPVTPRSSVVISGMALDNNGGLLKTDGFDSIRLENVSLKNASLKRKALGGDLVDYEEEFIAKMATGSPLEITRAARQ